MPKNKSFRLIIDTNLWISFVISHKLNQLDHVLFENKVRLLFSAELISEIKQTIAKPKLRKHFGINAFEEMFSTFEPFVDLIEVESIVVLCRDPNDNFLLALAKDGKADYLLTGDNDLLTLKKLAEQRLLRSITFLQL